MRKLQLITLCVLTLCLSLSASADVINIDFEGNPAGDTNHVGPDGIFSTTGPVWTSITFGSGLTPNLPNEFGIVTPLNIDIVETSGGGLEPLNNNLQDSGIYAKDIIITGLLPNETYNIATYIGFNTGFQILNGGPILGGYPGNTPLGPMPGILNQDYFIFANVAPYLTTSGDYAINFFAIDGNITGLQIDGVVPEPATLSFLALGALGLLRRRKRI